MKHDGRKPASRVGALLGVALVLAACGNPWSEHARDADAIALSGWAVDDARVIALPVYCYRTLAEPDCHDRPVADAASRLVGADGAPLGVRPDAE